MKKNIVILFLSVAYIYGYSQEANLRKTVVKELNYYKKNVNDYVSLGTEIRRKDSIIANLRATISEYYSELISYKSKVNEMYIENQFVDVGAAGDGKSYQIRLGNIPVSNVTNLNTESRSIEIKNNNGVLSFQLGVFRDYTEAKTYLDLFKKMGINQAFIMEYKLPYVTSNLSAISTSGSSTTKVSNPDVLLSGNQNFNVRRDENGNEVVYINTVRLASNKVATGDKKTQDNWELVKDKNGEYIMYLYTKPDPTNFQTNPSNRYIQSVPRDFSNVSSSGKSTINSTGTSSNAPATVIGYGKPNANNNYNEVNTPPVVVKSTPTTTPSYSNNEPYVNTTAEPTNSDNTTNRNSYYQSSNTSYATRPANAVVNVSKTPIKPTNVRDSWDLGYDENGNQIIIYYNR